MGNLNVSSPRLCVLNTGGRKNAIKQNTYIYKIYNKIIKKTYI